MKPCLFRSFFFILLACVSFEPYAQAGENGQNGWHDKAQAKSAILFIGDGMGLAHVVGGRLWFHGTDGRLNMESMPFTGFSRTYCTNSNVTDSAAGATALASGVKTYGGSIGMTDKNYDPSGQSRPLQLLTQLARAQGKSIGVVTTTEVTHATPAGFYAHVANREMGVEIAELVAGSGLSVLMGGGRKFFYPTTWHDPVTSEPGLRKDGRNLVGELGQKGYTYVDNLWDFKKLDPKKDNLKVIALFSPSHMMHELDRSANLVESRKQTPGQPSLAEMVEFAIKLLSRNPRGFFLMVEGGEIDHAAHATVAHQAFGDVIAFDTAIGQAREMVGEDSLVVVTADHETGGLALVLNGIEPHQSLLESPKFGRTPDKAKEAGVVGWGGMVETGNSPQQYAPHTGIDVPVMAEGPGAEQFSGFMNNSDIPWKIARIMGMPFTSPVNIENRNALKGAGTRDKGKTQPQVVRAGQ